VGQSSQLAQLMMDATFEFQRIGVVVERLQALGRGTC